MTSKNVFHFDVIIPEQCTDVPVFSFAARSDDIGRFARIERAGRNETGALQGFQRPQIAGHIREIRDYLEKPSSILPNPIVVAFTNAVLLERTGDHIGRLTIDAQNGPPGWIVDGQQRFTALSELKGRQFEVLVSGFICKDIEELQRQFILINNTKPLPKALVYELLPQVSDLPHRMSNRSQAALMTEALNYRDGSSLKGLIKQQTNPKGIIRDTILQRLILNSLNDGVLRLYANDDRLLIEKGTYLISEFFHAVQFVFREDWEGHTPTTSRLVHGAGIIAMGYLMETLVVALDCEDRQSFAKGLALLRGKTAWSSGSWRLAEDDQRKWNSLQNVPADIRQLSFHLVSELKASMRSKKVLESADIKQ